MPKGFLRNLTNRPAQSGQKKRAAMSWKINLAKRTATHSNGLVLRFSPATDTPGAWDGRIEHPLPPKLPLNASHLARLMREAGDHQHRAIMGGSGRNAESSSRASTHVVGDAAYFKRVMRCYQKGRHEHKS